MILDLRFKLKLARLLIDFVYVLSLNNFSAFSLALWFVASVEAEP